MISIFGRIKGFWRLLGLEEDEKRQITEVRRACRVETKVPTRKWDHSN